MGAVRLKFAVLGDLGVGCGCRQRRTSLNAESAEVAENVRT
jgi:hypothetical protein